MSKAKHGDTVKVHYSGKLEDGTVFDTTDNQDPLQITLGSGQIIPDLEQAIVEMSPGESKNIEIPAEKGFGPYLKELVFEVDRTQVPPDLKLELGQQLQMNPSEGQPIVVTVVDLTDQKVTLDANHPLAGKNLTFEIKLIEII